MEAFIIKLDLVLLADTAGNEIIGTLQAIQG